MNGYVCFWKGKRIEIYADTTYQAQCKAAEQLKVSKKKQYEITVILAEKNSVPVVHNPQDIVG